MPSYQRDKAGVRIDFHGMNTVRPPDAMPPGKYPFAQNIRAYMRDGVTSRATQDSSVMRMDSGAVHSLRRLNDSTPAGPAAGFILVGGVSTSLYANASVVDSGLSGNPISLLPFRPNQSVQPWMYVGDSLKMDKVRSDGLTYKMGIKEPQAAPIINTSTTITSILSLLGPVNVLVWNMANGDSSSVNGTPYIWRNVNDPSGRGPIQTAAAAALSVSGNSLAFDEGVSPAGSYAIPVKWAQYQIDAGTVNTAGTAVTWVSGDQFSNIAAGQQVIIAAATYTVAASPVPTNTTFSVTSSAGTQTGVNYYASVASGTIPLYQPALSADGYVFSAGITGTFYVPAPGTYTLSGNYVNDIIFGIGNSGQGTATWSNTAPISSSGQTKTVINGYPLLPRTTLVDGNGYSYGSLSVAVTFSAAGNYPFEIEWNYGDDQHAFPARIMFIKVNGSDITPLPATAITAAQYRYTYRSSATGATSNPSPETSQQVLSVLSNTLTATPSTDPQVDKIDFYRFDTGLSNFTYVGTGPNSSAAFSDTLLDTEVAANPILEFDNYEPFPSIDLPKKGIVDVAGGVATWVSGDLFNVRWLPGTVIIVGTVAYTLDKRPTDTTHLTATNVETVAGVNVIIPISPGTNLPYEIAEPILAAQPLPYIWGPTDNVAFAFGCGDPLRPGTLYWSKGNNLDAAPDTNQQDLTSPSEPLQNGCIVNGLGLVFSTERAFLAYPNFFNALATVQGTVGQTWTIQESIADRGLYIPRALAVEGGGNVFFRTKDGISVSRGGVGADSITDDDLFNLFPHEGMIPQPVTRGGYTVFPPDDTKPMAQKMNCADGYLYYDYEDVEGFPQTLVFDINAQGWVLDEYETPVVLHILEEGAGVNGTLTGCIDGTVRPLTNTGNEDQCSVLLMPSDTAGDVRATKHWADLYVEAGPQGS